MAYVGLKLYTGIVHIIFIVINCLNYLNWHFAHNGTLLLIFHFIFFHVIVDSNNSCAELMSEPPMYFENFNITDVVTPVNHVILQKLLEQAEYCRTKTKFLVKGFREGFSIGYKGPTDAARFAPNLKFQIANATVLWNKIMKKVGRKGMLGLFHNCLLTTSCNHLWYWFHREMMARTVG